MLFRLRQENGASYFHRYPFRTPPLKKVNHVSLIIRLKRKKHSVKNQKGTLLCAD